MKFSIRYQVMLPLLALMLGLVGASSWSAWASGQHARRQIEKQIDRIADTIRTLRIPPDAHLPVMKEISGAEFLLCDAERRPLRDDDGNLIGTLATAPDDLPLPSDAPTQHFDKPVSIGNNSYLCGGMPLTHGARRGSILYIFYPESLWRDTAWQALQPALLVGVIGSLVSIVLSVLIAQGLTGRIEDMERRTRLIAEGDFSPMPLPDRNDELRDLAQSINEMAHRLAEFQETIRQTERLRLLGQVSGGLAHQLRNGVAGARLAVQVHAQDCPAPHEGEALDVALRQLQLVEMHLKRFLDLGKAMELQLQPCDLTKILRDTIDLVGPQCRHAHIDLRIVAPPAAVNVQSDPAQLGQVFLNVITNAIEAAGPNGWVEVRWGFDERGAPGASAAGGVAYIEVRDSGPGPSPDIAERLFEPFVTGKREGVGLGLAVARQVAEAHHGSIRFTRQSGATCFRIELPILV